MAILVEKTHVTLFNWRDLAVAFTVGQLIFYRVYTDFFAIYSNPRNHYYVKSIPSMSMVMALITASAVSTVVLYAAIAFARRVERPSLSIALRAFLSAAVSLALFWVVKVEAHLSINDLNILGEHAFIFGSAGILFLAVASIAIKMLGLPLLIKKITNIAYFALLALTAVSAYMAMKLFYCFFTAPAIRNPVAVSSLAKSNNHPSQRRIVMLVFDEADYRILFEHRPVELKLPAIDNLVSNSFFCKNAFPPAGNTSISMPSIITGKYLIKTVPFDSDTIMLHGRKGLLYGDWKSVPGVFEDLAKKGIKCGLTGWSHPYSRVFKPEIVTSRWYEVPTQVNSLGSDYHENVINIFRSAVETKVFSILGQSLATETAVRNYFSILDDTETMVSSGGYNFVFAHFPVPHPPFFYEMKTKSSQLSNSRQDGYIDALALMDITVKKVVDTLKNDQAYNESMLIVTSDHWWRASNSYDGKHDKRVPFIVKLPGQLSGYVYKRRFNTFVARSMILAYLNDNYSDADGLASWLDVNAFDIAPAGGQYD